MRKPFSATGLRALAVVLGVVLAMAGSAFALTAHHGARGTAHRSEAAVKRAPSGKVLATPTARVARRNARAVTGKRADRVGAAHRTLKRSTRCVARRATNRRRVYCDKTATVHVGSSHFVRDAAKVHVKCAGTGACVLDVKQSYTEKLKGRKVVSESALATGRRHHRRHKHSTRELTKSFSSKVRVKAAHAKVITVRLNHSERALLHQLGTFKLKLEVTPANKTKGSGVGEILVFKAHRG